MRASIITFKIKRECENYAREHSITLKDPSLSTISFALNLILRHLSDSANLEFSNMLKQAYYVLLNIILTSQSLKLYVKQI